MVRRERVEPIPNITVQAIAGHNYEFGITTAGVQASIPLPIFNRNQGTVREAQSDLTRDHAEHERVALSLRERLAEASTRYHDALQSVEDFRAESLPIARRAYEMQLANFRTRRAAWPQVLVAQRTYVELNQEYVQSLLELRRAEVEIGGMLLVDGLSPAGPADVAGPHRVGAAAALIPGRDDRRLVRGRPSRRLRRVSCGDGAARRSPSPPPGCSPREEPPPRPTSPDRRARAAGRGRPSSAPRRR